MLGRVSVPVVIIRVVDPDPDLMILWIRIRDPDPGEENEEKKCTLVQFL
jgi:hypothetical protein